MPNFTEQALLSLCSNSEVLNLRNQNVRDEDLTDILNFLTTHPQVKTVDLSVNRLGDVGAKNFALHNTTATTVNLSINQIGAEGAKNFALHNTTATTVDLSHNKIGADGAKHFALHNKTVTTVDLSWNRIGDVGAKDFARHNTTATTVDLSWNEIGDVGMKALVSNLALQTVEASGNCKLTRVGNLALNEKNPRKRACYGREVGLPSDVPSLLRLSLFSFKEKLIGDNQGQLRSFNKDDLKGLEDLVPLLNRNKI